MSRQRKGTPAPIQERVSYHESDEPMARSKEEEEEDRKLLFNGEAMQANIRSVNFSRTFLSLVAGAVAGILGLRGIPGFLFYFVIMAAQSGTLLLKAKLNAAVYFLSLQAVVFDGILPNVLLFVLFWTLIYDYVHIF
ncbi:hypothetical protein KFL_001390050 [Klebsormidium nitens]|uniref:ER membrane protein complex subunit 6 n=1 Tax=Klebsormidium nitens TaxID=105231 RepID=A0A1Y1I361_KLENI|nr:hypothetical protein KFL_001390050 [Klebsormidium nitens]|eukprot:GAQ83187.1 hypothetical protein KFL_001390050 [Klebsormidium nitens]